jgi:hypothetical protein
MGWLGPDTFDNDRALNYLSDVKQSIWAKIEGLQEYPDLADPDEPHSDEIVAAVELLAILCEHTPCTPPATAVVEKCRDNFVEFWYSAMRQWIDSDDTAKPNAAYVEQRRDAIERTFDRLLAQCRKADEEGIERE